MIKKKPMVMKLVRENGQEIKFELTAEWWEHITSANTWKEVTGGTTAVPQHPEGSWPVWGTKRMPVSQSEEMSEVNR